MAGRSVLLTCVAFAAIAATTGFASALTLQEAVSKALNEHPQIAAARERLTASEFRLDQANASLMPTVDLEADVGKQFVDRPNSLDAEDNARWWARRQATISAKYVLFDGWNRANAIYRDAARVDAATLGVIENSEALALSVVEAYIDYRRHSFLLGIADENIQNHKGILSLTRARISGGSGTQSEKDLVEERLAAAQAVRAEVLQAFYEAEAKFRAAVGADPGKTHKVPYPAEMPRSKAAATELALARNPTLAAREAEADAFAYELERTKSDQLPLVTLEGSAQMGHDLNAVPGKNDDYSVRLRMAWRLYDGGARNARVGEAGALAAEAKLKRDIEIRNIFSAIESTFGKLSANGERLAAVEKQIASSKRVAVSYRQEFEASKRSLLDLLDAENSVFSSRFESASVSGVRLFSAYYLKALTGTLVESLGLSAPVDRNASRRDIVIGSKSISSFKIEPLRQGSE